MKIDLKSLFKRKSSAPVGDSAAARSLPPQVESALIWVKANSLLVILATASVAALGAGWWYQGEFQAANEAEAQSYAGKAAELTRLQNSEVTITIPGSAPITTTTVVTQLLVEKVKERMKGGGSDSTEISRDAIAHNRGAHEPVINLRLPAKDPIRQQIHLDFFKALTRHFGELLTEIDAGSPPSDEDVTVKLQRRQVRFVQSSLKKAGDATLTSEERSQLQPELISYRLGLYREAAQNHGIYCEVEAIGLPAEQPAKGDLQRLWSLQWHLWIAQDIVRACKSVNGDAKILEAPVKRITRIQFLGPVIAREGPAPAEPEGDSAPAVDAEGNPIDAPPSAPPINPSAPVNIAQFAVSSKGWATNQLYDVFSSRVSLVVETSKIPDVSNAFSKQNFIVITDVKIRPVDPFVAANEGFVYGDAPVSEITLTLESAWLRAWTGPLMPDEVRKALNTSGALIGMGQDAATEPTKEN